jgi:phage gp29-like protein
LDSSGVQAHGLIREAVATKAKAVFTADQQIIEDGVADVLSRVSSPVSETDIHNAIKAASSYEDLADRLAVLFGETDTTEFRTVLERATFTADVLGFANVAH